MAGTWSFKFPLAIPLLRVWQLFFFFFFWQNGPHWTDSEDHGAIPDGNLLLPVGDGVSALLLPTFTIVEERVCVCGWCGIKRWRRRARKPTERNAF